MEYLSDSRNNSMAQTATLIITQCYDVRRGRDGSSAVVCGQVEQTPIAVLESLHEAPGTAN